MDVFPRLRDTLTRGLGKRSLTPSPDKSAGQAPTRAPTQVGTGRGKVAKHAKPRQECGAEPKF
jgi:hypothetical protein